MSAGNFFLSKSQYIKGLQCLKHLYLYKYRPDLKDLSVSEEAVLQSGTDVGVLAQQLFPNGITIPFDDISFDEQMAQTLKAMDEGSPAVYEATFLNNGLFTRVDILSRERDGWAINEVKASTEVKDAHYNDIAFQFYVLRSMGLPVTKANIVHVNNQYERIGDLDLSRLFAIKEITEDVKTMQADVEKNIDLMRELREDAVPVIDIGEQCSDPYECSFAGHCWQHIPDPSVFSIRGRGVDAFGFYRKGVLKLEDVPLDELPESAQLQVTAYLKKREYIDRDGISEFLETLSYPIAYLDFETFMTAVPPYDYMRPYEQVPFQYSLHIQRNKTSEIEHYKFLAEPGVDPRQSLIEKLLAEIPEGACVMAYNMAFEKRVLNRLSEMFPALEKKIVQITENMVDLMTPFRSRAYYSWEMMGSYSIKAVLPVLAPALSYDTLEIGDGGTAMEAYWKMCESQDQEEINNIRKSLLEYCHLDTLAMVKILDKLRMLVA